MKFCNQIVQILNKRFLKKKRKSILDSNLKSIKTAMRMLEIIALHEEKNVPI